MSKIVIFLFLFSFGCGQAQTKQEKINLEKEENDSIAEIKSENLKYLPYSINTFPKCINEDFKHYWQVEIDEDLKEKGFKFYDYFFDTIVDTRHLAFTFRCIGSENKIAIEERFYQEFNEWFSEMASPDYKESKGCFYLIVSDSIELKENKILYKRYRGYNLGGQSQASEEVFLLTENQLNGIVNSLEYSKLDAFELIQYRTKNIIY